MTEHSDAYLRPNPRERERTRAILRTLNKMSHPEEEPKEPETANQKIARALTEIYKRNLGGTK